MANVKFFVVSALKSFSSNNHTGIFVHLTSQWTDTSVNPNKVYEPGLYFGGTAGWEYLTNDSDPSSIGSAIDAKINALDTSADVQPVVYTAANTTTGAKLTFKGVSETNGIIGDGSGTDELLFAKVATTGAAADVSYAGNSDYDSEPNNVEEALDDLYHKISDIQSGSVTSFESQTGDITIDTTYLKMTGKQLGVDNVDSTYITGVNVNTPTDLATVATVTAALETLDVTGYAQGAIDTTTTGQTTFTVKGIQEADGKISDDSSNNTNLVIDGTYNASTNKIATQSTVTTAIKNALDSEVTFKGVTGTQPTQPTNGDMWKASGAITIAAADAGEGVAFTTKAGYTIIYKYDSAQGATGNGWYLIPSADDVEDTWRDINVNGSQLLGSGTSTGAVNFVNATSNPVTVTGNGNNITIQHTAPSNFTATSDAAVKITTDNFGHITGTSTLNAIDIPYAGESSVSGSEPATVEQALDDLYIKLNTTTANGITGITVGNQSLKITSNIADLKVGNGLQVSKDSNTNDVTIDAKADSTNYLTVGNGGLAINPSKVDSTYITDGTVNTSTDLATVATVTAALDTLDVTEFAIAEKDSSDIITIHGIYESDGKIAVGSNTTNDITLAKVAATGSASDVTVNSANYGGSTATTNLQTALTNLNAAVAVADGNEKITVNAGTPTVIATVGGNNISTEVELVWETTLP